MPPRAPRFAVASPAVPRRPLPWGWWLAAALLALALGLQLALADRARLAGDPAWRPRLETLCGLLGCDLGVLLHPGEVDGQRPVGEVRPLAERHLEHQHRHDDDDGDDQQHLALQAAEPEQAKRHFS